MSEPGARRRVRSAGSRWRILVHKRGPSPWSWHVGSHRRDAAPAAYLTCTTLEGAEFDELVIGKWMHLEQTDTGSWYLNVGGVTLNIRADRDGRPKRVDVYGPGDYGEAAEGCRYEVMWTGAP